MIINLPTRCEVNDGQGHIIDADAIKLLETLSDKRLLEAYQQGKPTYQLIRTESSSGKTHREAKEIRLPDDWSIEKGRYKKNTGGEKVRRDTIRDSEGVPVLQIVWDTYVGGYYYIRLPRNI